MGSVIHRSRFSKEVKLKLGIFAVYFVAALVFFYFGFQPATKPEDVYAEEASQASAMLSLDNTAEPLPVKTIKKQGKELEVPEQIVGAYSTHENKTLLIGHSSTAFSNLKDLQLGDKVTYNGKEYTITDIVEKQKQDISMKEILKAEETDTLVLMTCAGEPVNGTNDYTHRLIVTAK